MGSRASVLKRLRQRWDDAKRVIDMASLVGLEHGTKVFLGQSRLDYRSDLVQNALKMAVAVEKAIVKRSGNENRV